MNQISTTTHRTRLQAISAATLVALVALTGAMWMTVTAPAPEVIRLERVVIEGARTPDLAEVQQLPRVVVTGKRNAGVDGTQVAAACTAQTLC